MKRIVSVFTAILLIISTVPISHVFAAADVTKPVLENISVDKKEVTAGDTVKISVNASDDVAVSRVSLYYYTPISQRSFSVPLSYNPENGIFESNISIDENIESGTFKINYMIITDTTGNQTYLSQGQDPDGKLQGGEYTVTGTSGADFTNPTLEEIIVNKKEATLGDTVNISVKASDDVAVSRVSLYYYTPISQRSFSVPLSYNPENGIFESNISIDENIESGTFKINYMIITDTTGNQTYLSQGQDPEGKLQDGEFTVTGTSGADVTKPTLEEIIVNKKEATLGDTVNISVKASDDVAVSRVSLYYYTPISQRSFSVPLSYNYEKGVFEGYISIDENIESGTFKINYMIITDTTGNQTYLSPGQDPEGKLPNGNFTIFTEFNPPSFSKLSIDKNSVESGDYVNFTIDATDDTNLSEATINYVSPVSQTKHAVSLSYDGQHFTGQMYIDKNTEVGQWTVDSIVITDTNENSTVVKAVETDLSAGNFTVLKSVTPLNSYIVTSNETWSNKTVNSDVYISPGAILNINGNVIINGNVYVLGGLRSYGGLTITGELHANSIYFGYYTPSNGQAIFTGSNYISSMIASNRILTEVPFTVYDTPLVSSNGKVNLTGATLPFVTLGINGQNVPLRTDGTFKLNDFYIGDSNTLNVKITDLYGYTYYYSYNVADIYIDEFTKNSQTITGKALPHSTIKILENNSEIEMDTADEKGYFSIGVSNLTENTTLRFEVYNEANELVTTKDVLVKDITPPETPVVNEVSDKDKAITGAAEAGATITVMANGNVIGTGTAGTDGKFSVSIPMQPAGVELAITATDKAGNVSETTMVAVKDVTPPAKPAVNQVTEKDASVTGTAEAGSKVEVKINDSVIGSGTVETDGKFSVTIPVQKAGVELVISATDKAGNVSEATTVVVKDVTSPGKPVVNEVTDKDTSVSGSAEAGTLVDVKVNRTVISSATADTAGKFVVTIPVQKAGTELVITATDKAGNVSEATTVVVKDVTSPAKPIVNEVTDKDTSVSGAAEAGSKVEVKVNDSVIGSATGGLDGKFSVTIPVQKSGTEIVIIATDMSGNVSEETKLVVSKGKLSGWIQENGTWFFYDKTTGEKKTGWFLEGATWYFFDTKGAMKTGWFQDGPKWYFFKNSGAMQTGWMKDGNTWYFFNTSGAMKTGWLLDGSTWYFFHNSGAMKTGWLQSGSTWYYFKGSGAMQTGWLLDGSTWYYFNESGTMKTGWLLSGSTWYYFKSSGAMQTDWAQISGKWYYFNQSGALK
ncbi:Ig-like domain-containing protein [Neobacillus sp. NPDC097160]|uniref:Ig-like domain-containing protein n=1 Tax=Neobacillus sp. NPDC097160 TaxID=3364298 RepID=UPI00380DF5D9